MLKLMPITANKLRIYAFLVYTRLAFYTAKLLNEVAAFAAAYSPDSVKIRPKINPAAPIIYSARALCKKTGMNYNITNLTNLVVDRAWDQTACGNTGGIQLNQIGHFTKYYNPDLIWICHGLSNSLNPGDSLKPSDILNPSDSLKPSESDQEMSRHYILIDLAHPMQIFRYTRSNLFDSNAIKKIADPMFGELSFDPNSTWE
jgi:hypothetical protein